MTDQWDDKARELTLDEHAEMFFEWCGVDMLVRGAWSIGAYNELMAHLKAAYVAGQAAAPAWRPQLEGAALRYLRAVRRLAKVKDGKTLFEGSPTNDQECFDAWKELNDAGRALDSLLPDEPLEAGVLHWEAPPSEPQG